MRVRSHYQKAKLREMEQFWKKGKYRVAKPVWVEFDSKDKADTALKVYFNAWYEPDDRNRLVGLGAMLDWVEEQGWTFRWDATHKRFIGGRGSSVRYILFQTIKDLLCVNIPREMT